jgi:hypothetical protein
MNRLSVKTKLYGVATVLGISLNIIYTGYTSAAPVIVLFSSGKTRMRNLRWRFCRKG